MNKWGWGDWSAITSVKASTWPDVVDQPTTSIDPASGANGWNQTSTAVKSPVIL